MSQAADFLNSIFATYDGDLVFDVEGEELRGGDSPFLEKHAGNLRVSPITDAGSCFVFGVLDEDATPEAYQDCTLQPTAQLYRDGIAIFVWAFDGPVSDSDDLVALGEALGMDDVTEIVPVPGTDGWELTHHNGPTYPLGALVSVYVDGVDPTDPDGDPVAADDADEADDEGTAGQRDEVAGASGASASAVEPGDVIAPQTYGNATMVTPYNDGDYGQEVIVTVGGKRESRQWKPTKMPAGQFFADLCVHREGQKDGLAYVLGDMVPGQRLKTSVKALSGVGLDIDTGTPTVTVDNALKKLGCAAVRYSTHSSGKTKTEIKKDKVMKFAGDREIDADLIRYFLREVEQWDQSIVDDAEYLGTDHTEKGIVCQVSHPPMPKHRIVLLFKESFVIENEAPTQAEAMKKWAKVPEALARLLNVPFDTSCTDPSRLFYYPRHAKGKPFSISLFGGPLFDWKTLELEDPMERLSAAISKGKSKSVTDEGRELGRWSLKRAHGFQIADVVDAYAPDRIRHNTGRGYEIECPFDEDHSNSGDQEDRACLVVNAGEGPSEFFTISCRHETCRDKTNLDMLGKMIKDGWFEKSVIDEEQFNAILDDEDKPEIAAKIEKQDNAKLGYSAAIDALHTDSTDEEIEAVVAMVLDAEITTLQMDRVEQRMQKQITGMKVTTLRKVFEKLRRKKIGESVKGGNRTEDGKMVFRYQSDFNFDDAYNICIRALKEQNHKHSQPIYSCMSSEPVRLMTKTEEGRTSINFETISNQTLWSELNELVTFVRSGDQGDGSRGKVPEDVGKQVYEQAYRKLPASPEVIYTPLFLSDGALLMRDGYYYDAQRPEYLNILMVSNGLVDSMPPVELEPTYADVEEAVDWIETELLSDFPFLDNDSEGEARREPSLANAFAMLLTPFMRRMIHGRTPVFFVYKPQPGTGGTLLGQLPMWLFDGEAGSATRYSQNEEEMQKGLIAAVQEPRSHLFFDDVKDFNNRELLRAITQANISGRLLGSSKNVSVPNRFNWVGTGNNTVILDEMRRRTVYIKLNAQMPDATERVFRHPDISGMSYTGFVQKNRPLAVKHILTMIQYWIKAGKPPFTLRRRASFEDWSAKVGGVLQACGVEGFIDNFASTASDFDDSANRQFIRDFAKRFGTASVQSANALFDWALDAGLDIISGNNDDQKRTRFMKNSLISMIDRTFKIGDENFMFQQTVDDEQNTGFHLVKIGDQHEKKAAA